MTFADRVLVADVLRYALCPGCQRLHKTDPSRRVPVGCPCGLLLTVRPEVVGISLVETAGPS